MKTRIAVLFAVFAAWSGGALAAVNWIDWNTVSAGTLNTGSGVTNVTRTGSTPMGLANGDGYYNHSSTGGTSPTGTYAGLMPSDVLQVDAASTFTISFGGATIINPYIALVSVGNTGRGVTYDFNAPVTVISAGGNQWGYGGYTVGADSLTGYEYNGILRLTGSFTSLTFTTSPNEYWHGFNIGVSTAPVPEPAPTALLAAGLLGLAALRARRRNMVRGRA